MRVTFHGHACVAIRQEGTTVVVDPGAFADAGTALRGARAVLVTHEHPDHVDPAALGAALATTPELEVWAPGAVVRLLQGTLPDGAAARVHAVAPGDGLEIGGVAVTVGGGQHAVIHRDVPRIANLTYLLRADGATVYHPGDSFDLPGATTGREHRLDVLLAPVSGPWLKMSETIDTVRAVDPWIVVPIHDALLSDAGLGSVDRLLGAARTGGSYDYRRLTVGEFVEIGRASTAAAAHDVLRDHPEYAEVALLEEDETVPPRPEEEAADAARE
ncbi:MBL fold metallo-hydrolase [Cellulosimicrobium arenosum]|uniref:MBL fold metallo-hydrolase n=1 Tax=Cellulosimicrobium arenosum TaxID=2708133 RepID=UPI0019D6B7F3|nr:MBL fold metallo-hydrolase [Cellulosimicrobium arenosum]